MAVTAAASAAERMTVARWRRAPDPSRGEPMAIAGEEHRLVAPDGTVLHAAVSGTGPTVVLAHGFTATSHYWAPVAQRLLDGGHRVVVYDQRGHGRSVAGPDRFGTDELTMDLRTVVDELVSEPGAVLAGHSLGGIAIQAGIAAHPELLGRVGGLVLVSTLARPVQVPLGELMARLGGTALSRKVMAHDVHGRFVARGGVGTVPALTTIDVVRTSWAGCPDRTRAGVMRDLREYDFSDTLRALELPVTVLCGDHDNVTPIEESRRMADLLPAGRLVVVPGGGHALPWEAADQVTEAIAALAATVSGRPIHDLDQPRTGAT